MGGICCSERRPGATERKKSFENGRSEPLQGTGASSSQSGAEGGHFSPTLSAMQRVDSQKCVKNLQSDGLSEAAFDMVTQSGSIVRIRNEVMRQKMLAQGATVVHDLNEGETDADNDRRSSLAAGYDALDKDNLAKLEEQKKTEEAAAAKIQATYRGGAVREQLETQKKAEAASKDVAATDAAAKGAVAKDATEQDTAAKDAAAAKIQANFRGGAVREDLKNKKAEDAAARDVAAKDAAAKDAAATKIQANFRGGVAREDQRNKKAAQDQHTSNDQAVPDGASGASKEEPNQKQKTTEVETKSLGETTDDQAARDAAAAKIQATYRGGTERARIQKDKEQSLPPQEQPRKLSNMYEADEFVKKISEKNSQSAVPQEA